MTLKEITSILERTGVSKVTVETIPRTYSTTKLSSFLTVQIGNRAASSWKKAQYIVAAYDDSNASQEEILDGWKSMTISHGEQFLILEEEPNIWSCYNSTGDKVSLEKVLIGKSLKTNAPTPYRQYITAIKSKPFLLLAGISGTGKSRIVRELARSCWDKDSEEYKAQKPRNFEMIQVKPNWHDSSELFGYVSRINGERFIVGPFLKFMVRAMQEPDVPYFLCLDEMNLAPVEQYFAEYLSVIESRKLKDDGTIETDPIVDFESTDAYHSLITQLFPKEDEEEDRRLFLSKEGGKRLSIPPNLIVVGTVNMDETTFSFSRKVLDRAMTIEMNEVDLRGGLTDRYELIERQSVETLVGNAVEGVDVYASHQAVCDICLTYLQKVNEVLEETPFKVAYRTRNEVLLYVVNNLPYNKSADGTALPQEYVIARALDEITNMKILSRIEGDESKVRKDRLDRLEETIREGLESISGRQYGAESMERDDSQVEKSISIAKLKEMTKKLTDSGYTSYWS